MVLEEAHSLSSKQGLDNTLAPNIYLRLLGDIGEQGRHILNDQVVQVRPRTPSARHADGKP